MNERTIEVNGEPADYFTQLVWAGLATMPLLPATVVPAGRTASGLPVGVQIVGPRYGDRTTLQVAGLVESVLGGFTAPPGG
jgi:amidase